MDNLFSGMIEMSILKHPRGKSMLKCNNSLSNHDVVVIFTC